MLVAAIDTATLTLSCALLELRGRRGRGPDHPAPTGRPGPAWGHGIRLPGALTDLLAALGRKVPDVEGFAVGLGPGSFTGLRIGLATWKGLAYANRRPIAGVSSLAAMALEAAAALPPGSDALLVPLLDARKGEVYAGFYRAAGGRGGGGPARGGARPGGAGLPDRGAGPGRRLRRGLRGPRRRARRGASRPRRRRRTRPSGRRGRAARRAARSRGAAFDDQALFALEPHYVRKSEAEVKFPNGIP